MPNNVGVIYNKRKQTKQKKTNQTMEDMKTS
jgi:hypothetical protein